MPQKWNLQDIKPANTPKTSQKPSPVRGGQSSDIEPRRRIRRPKEEPRVTEPDFATTNMNSRDTTKRKRMTVTTIIIVVILVFGFFMNMVLGGATITIHPKVKDISVQSEFTAYAAPQAGALGYELLTLDASAEKQVKAAGQEEASEQATGEIVVYNTKSTSPQRLITNTRFESEEGLVFRIKESIVVPAVSEDAEGNMVPGTVTAEVFADEPGEAYNIPPSRFTVPGLEGTDQYESVYAESSAAFTGGFVGERYIIDDAEFQTAQEELRSELREMLLEQLEGKMPAGFVLYEDAVTFTYESLPATTYGDSLATIKEVARLQVPIFKEEDFSSYLAAQSLPDYTDEPVTIQDPQTLSFTYTEPVTAQTDISLEQELEFTLEGDAKLIFEYDADQLKNDLAGTHKSRASEVFGRHSSIGHAQSEVKPFWAKYFPEDPEDIRIVPVIE